MIKQINVKLDDNWCPVCKSRYFTLHKDEHPDIEEYFCDDGDILVCRECSLDSAGILIAVINGDGDAEFFSPKALVGKYIHARNLVRLWREHKAKHVCVPAPSPAATHPDPPGCEMSGEGE